MRKVLAVIMGPTAVGKTDLAFALAKKHSAEILSVDSRQFYRDFTIGTCSPDQGMQREVVHHGLSFLELNESFSADRFRDKYVKWITESEGAPLIVVGGSGLYVKHLVYKQNETRPQLSLEVSEKIADLQNKCSARELYQQLSAMDPVRAKQIHPNDVYRIIKALESFFMTGKPYSSFALQTKRRSIFADSQLLILIRDKNELQKRILKRMRSQLKSGWIKEVALAIQNGADSTWPSFQALGYRSVVEFLNGAIGRQKLVEMIYKDTINYARKQNAFFLSQFPDASKNSNYSLFDQI